MVLGVAQLLQLSASPLQLSNLVLQLSDQLLCSPLRCLLLLPDRIVGLGLSLLEGMNQGCEELVVRPHVLLCTCLQDGEKNEAPLD